MVDEGYIIQHKLLYTVRTSTKVVKEEERKGGSRKERRKKGYEVRRRGGGGKEEVDRTAEPMLDIKLELHNPTAIAGPWLGTALSTLGYNNQLTVIQHSIKTGKWVPKLASLQQANYKFQDYRGSLGGWEEGNREEERGR